MENECVVPPLTPPNPPVQSGVTLTPYTVARVVKGGSWSKPSSATGSNLTYSATGLPSGASIDPSTGLITGLAANTGTFTVAVTVTDGNSSDTQNLTVQVDKPKRINDTDASYSNYSDPDDINTLFVNAMQSDIIDTVYTISTIARAVGGAWNNNGTPVTSASGVADIKDMYTRINPDAHTNPNLQSTAHFVNTTIQGVLTGPTSAANIGTNNAAAQQIVAYVNQYKATYGPNAPRIHYAVWGQISTLAQAVKIDRSILDCLRIYMLGNWNISQDKVSFDYVVSQLDSNSLMMVNNYMFQAMYLTGDSVALMNYFGNKGPVTGGVSLGAWMMQEGGANGPPIAEDGFKNGDGPTIDWDYEACVHGLDPDDPSESKFGGGSFPVFDNGYYMDAAWTGSNQNHPTLPLTDWEHTFQRVRDWMDGY